MTEYSLQDQEVMENTRYVFIYLECIIPFYLLPDFFFFSICFPDLPTVIYAFGYPNLSLGSVC